MDEERMATAFRLNRVVRTPSSEIYMVWDGETRVGQIDIHYAHETIHATLLLEAMLAREDEEGLIAQIDDEVVQSYLPNFDREDFLVTVYRGEEVASYSDSSGVDEEMGPEQ